MKWLDMNRRRAGQVAVLFALFLGLVAIMAALSVDTGMLAYSHTRAQNAADAGALAAMLELWDQRAAGLGETQARHAAATAAAEVVSENYPALRTETEFGKWQDGTFTKLVSPDPAHAAQVTVYRDGSSPGGPDEPFFAGVCGIHEVNQVARAVCRFDHPGLCPFGVWEGELVSPGELMTMYDDAEVAPGAFGLLDFDGGENSASDLSEWTLNGYFGFFYIDPEVGSYHVFGSTGLKTSLKHSIGWHITEGDEVIVCIYRGITGTGAGTDFEIVGYASMVITDQAFVDETEEEYVSITGRLVSYYFFDSGDTAGTMRNFMDLALVE
ncbi:MAG: pilus assembly protein TadG-related protein [Candidatus Brocadiia bacterium]